MNKSRNPLEVFVRHQVKATEHASKAVFHLVTQESRDHGKAALRECLLSFRALIDGAVDTLGETPAAGETSALPPRGTAKKIKIEVD